MTIIKPLAHFTPCNPQLPPPKGSDACIDRLGSEYPQFLPSHQRKKNTSTMMNLKIALLRIHGISDIKKKVFFFLSVMLCISKSAEGPTSSTQEVYKRMQKCKNIVVYIVLS